MPTQKTFKQRVRTRMAKTGESYTAARHQLLRKVAEPAAREPASELNQPAPAAVAPDATANEPAVDGEGHPDAGPPAVPADAPSEAFQVSDEAMRRATGRSHAEWFAILDEWGATAHTHTEIAAWLSEAQGVRPWWTQSVTVAYERARGLRATHQMAKGYSVSATRTIATDPDRALEAFTSEPLRSRWLPGAALRRRPTRAALTARFDWAEPASRVVVTVTPKGVRATVAVQHEQLPDAASADHHKRLWRERLGALKDVLERG